MKYLFQIYCLLSILFMSYMIWVNINMSYIIKINYSINNGLVVIIYLIGIIILLFLAICEFKFNQFNEKK